MPETRKVPATVGQWLSLFRQLIGDMNLDRGFVGNHYYSMIANNVNYLTADDLCDKIVRACEECYGTGREGRTIIGNNSCGTSVLLCKEYEYPAYLRFVKNDHVVGDLGVSAVGANRYQFYRDVNCTYQYHNERYGGTVRRIKTPFEDVKYYNPDGSRDWGRSVRDLWESLKNG